MQTIFREYIKLFSNLPLIPLSEVPSRIATVEAARGQVEELKQGF